MVYIMIAGMIVLFVAILVGSQFGWELLQQNGRCLLSIEALEKRLNEIESAAGNQPIPPNASTSEPPGVVSHTTDGEPRENRFGNRSLASSKIKRDGLKAGTPAPDFRLPRLDGGELALSDLRGKLVLLVFSSPNCGPCNVLAPKLEKFHRKHPQLEMVMISKEDPEANREKVKEHGLTFPVVLQKKWEVSRDYAFFGTPVGYLIDSTGVIVADAAVGTDGAEQLMTRTRRLLNQNGKVAKQGLLGRGVRPASKFLHWLNVPPKKLKPM